MPNIIRSRYVNGSCASSSSGTEGVVFCHVLGYVTSVVAIDPTKCTLLTLLDLTFSAVSGILMRKQ